MILKWRTRKDITKYMNTDIEYNIENQRKWFEYIKNDPNNKYWVINFKEKPIGLIYLSDIDYSNKKTYWGYYIGEEKFKIYGSLIPKYLFFYVFAKMGFNKILAEVMEGNEKVLKLDKLLGFNFVGVLKNHIFKDGKYHNIYLLELLKENWIKNSKYDSFFE